MVAFSHLVGVPPPGEEDVVAEELGHVGVRHLLLHVFEQVGEPLKGVGVGTDPVEVNLT